MGKKQAGKEKREVAFLGRMTCPACLWHHLTGLSYRKHRFTGHRVSGELLTDVSRRIASRLRRSAVKLPGRASNAVVALLGGHAYCPRTKALDRSMRANCLHVNYEAVVYSFP